MPTSDEQLQSNRQNAQHSTGPKTTDGKARASRNAVKHGLYSNHTTLNSPLVREDRAEYERLLQSITTELLPESDFQKILVKRIVDSLWRLRRAVTAETGQIHRQLDSAESLSRTEQTINRLRGRFPAGYKKDNPRYDGLRADDVPSATEGSASTVTPAKAGAQSDTIVSSSIDDLPTDPLTNMLDSKLIPDDKFAQNLLRYELRLNRELIRTYELFNHLKMGGINAFIENQKSGRSAPSRSKPHRVSKKQKYEETNPDDF